MLSAASWQRIWRCGEAWPSADLLEPGGLATFAKRNLNLLLGGWLPDAMLVELPKDPCDVAWIEDGWRIQMPASGGDEWDHARTFIRDLCLRHHGEVREVQGSGFWNPFDGPLSMVVAEPTVQRKFHPAEWTDGSGRCLPHAGRWQPGRR